MTHDDTLTRRSLLRRGTVLGLVVLAPTTLLEACGGGEQALDCTNPTGLTAEARQQRQALTYQDHSPDPAKKCSACQFFDMPQTANQCGNCRLNLGPVNPEGTCTGFSPKT